MGERERGVDVPATFEPLNVGIPELRQPRQPGCLRTKTVRQVEADVDAPPSATMCVQSSVLLFTAFKRIRSSSLEPGAGFSYELTKNRGAALVTKYRTYRMDALVESALERYTKRHYESWVTFARHKDYADDVHPVLVYGFDMTKDFAMVAYSDDYDSSGADFIITVPTLASSSSSIWGTWRTKGSPHTNCGPQEGDPPPRERGVELPSPRSVEPGIIPSGFDQCVFVRYYTMRPRKRFGIFPKVIRAGAGPHDLGSGDSRGNTFPETMVQYDDELATSGEDFEGQRGPDPDDNNDIVVHSAQYVWLFP